MIKRLILLLMLISNTALAGVLFDGTDDFISAGSDATIDDMTAISVSVWVYAHTSGAGTYGRIVCKETTGLAGWRIQRHDDGASAENTISFTRDYNSADCGRVAAEGTLDLNVWTNFIITWDGSATATNIHIYENGVECSYVSAQNGTTVIVTDAAQTLYIGIRSGTTSPFDGELDEIYIYEKVLSAQEIAILSASRIKGVGLYFSDLRAYFPMNDQPSADAANGDIVHDLAGVNNGTADDGANNTGCTWSANTILNYPCGAVGE